jgi:hypothetical protein
MLVFISENGDGNMRGQLVSRWTLMAPNQGRAQSYNIIALPFSRKVQNVESQGIRRV